MYRWEDAAIVLPVGDMPDEAKGQDISPLFPPAFYSKKCAKVLPAPSCEAFGISGCVDPVMYQEWLKPSGFLAYEWEDVEHQDRKHSLFVYNGKVINAASFMDDIKEGKAKELLKASLGLDGTRLLSTDGKAKDIAECASQIYTVGVLEKERAGCFASTILTSSMFIVIVVVIVIRFFLAVGYRWCVVPSITKPKKLNEEDKNSYKRERVINLVTCYSEGEHSLRTTLDSIANTSYPDEVRHVELALVPFVTSL
jgi:hypothetical protein